MGDALTEFDEKLRREGYGRLCGIDEVGRGPLAGPVVAAAVVFASGSEPPGLCDSKKLTPAKRSELRERILASGSMIGIGSAGPDEIDSTNILRATMSAMLRAVAALSARPDIVLVDGNQRIRGLDITQKTIIKGDALSAAIAAASIIAKEHRDALMARYAETHPGYGFEEHSGYGTKAHLEAIARLGPCPIHRKTFKGVREHVPGAPRPGLLFPP